MRCTKLRLLLADVIALVGPIQKSIPMEVFEPRDCTVLEQELDRLQATVHRMIAFLDALEENTTTH